MCNLIEISLTALFQRKFGIFGRTFPAGGPDELRFPIPSLSAQLLPVRGGAQEPRRHCPWAWRMRFMIPCAQN